MKVLVLNVYFAPFSFGGATIVAEEMATRLVAEHDCQILVVTTINDGSILPYSIRRYRANGIDIIGINLPGPVNGVENYDHPQVSELVCEIIDQYQPDLVHVHSVQTLGCGYFDHIVDHQIRLAVTLHDCWWLCERQFMIASDERYCFQSKIRLSRCNYCVSDHQFLLKRDHYLRRQLGQADLLLFPSEFHRQLHVVNGLEANKCRVNKNGVRLPSPGYQKHPHADGKVVFGFVGGPGPIKGADLIIKALQELERDDYQLRVVDAAQTLGQSWQDQRYWDIPGQVVYLPPYSQETMDDFFSQLDVLLFPSQWKESFGMTVREALVRDVWVIASDGGGVVEDLVAGENATLVPMNGDYKPLLAAIEECLDRNDWKNYENPHRSGVRDHQQQADELYGYFQALMIDKLPWGIR